MKPTKLFGIIFCLVGIIFSANLIPSFALEPDQEPEPPQIPEPAPEPEPIPISKPPPPPEPFPGETTSEKIERLTLENEKLKQENKNLQSEISELNKKIQSLKDITMEQIRVILDLTNKLKEIIFEKLFSSNNFV